MYFIRLAETKEKQSIQQTFLLTDREESRFDHQRTKTGDQSCYYGCPKLQLRDHGTG